MLCFSAPKIDGLKPSEWMPTQVALWGVVTGLDEEFMHYAWPYQSWILYKDQRPIPGVETLNPIEFFTHAQKISTEYFLENNFKIRSLANLDIGPKALPEWTNDGIDIAQFFDVIHQTFGYDSADTTLSKIEKKQVNACIIFCMFCSLCRGAAAEYKNLINDNEDIDPNDTFERYQLFQKLYISGEDARALKILRELAEEGVNVAQAALGNILVFNDRSDNVEARKWLEMAVDAKVPDAFHGLGTIYLHGLGVERSAFKAAEILAAGANLGHAECATILGELWAGGSLGEPNHEFAITAYQAGASGGSALANRRLGSYYAEGQYVEKDLAIAHQFFEASAVKGDEYAANYLAGIYERGVGVDVDLDRAIALYSIAVEKGITTAIQNLAVCLSRRRSSEDDINAATYWFLKGAENGLKLSMQSLSIIYAKGDGVEKNLERSEYWAAQAVATEDPILEK